MGGEFVSGMPNIRAVCFDLDGLMFNTEVIFNEVGHELLHAGRWAVRRS